MTQTDRRRKRAYQIMALVTACCVFMAFIETVAEPAYAVKSAVKAVVFLLVPLIAARTAGVRLSSPAFRLDGKGVARLLALGFFIYGVILGGYVLTKNLFDYAALVESLSADQKVNADSFAGVAFYISFCNSFLEEFLFRLVAFVQLSRYASRKTAYLFSSVLFAVYHIGMIGTSFPPVLLVLALAGLTAGGLIFDCVDHKNGTLYNSWTVHMFADFAIMTIWYLHI